MAYYCEDCRLYFPRHVVNCPQCGQRPAADGRSDREMALLGYRPFSPAARPTQPEQIQDDDLLLTLRREYAQQYSTPAPSPSPTEEDPQEDFFTQLSSGPEPVFPQMELDPPGTPAPFPTTDFPGPACRRPSFQVREPFHRRAARRFSLVPWPLLLRVCFVLVVLLFLVILWCMRGALIQGVLSIFTALMPLVLMALALWWILRSVFRR